MTEVINSDSTCVKERIKWIDIAKGMAIILVIIGHTVPVGIIRNVIYSFHMPLFIILSGYTFSYKRHEEGIEKKIWGDFKRLMLPVFVVLVVSIFISFMESDYNINILFYQLIKKIEAFIWASGVTFEHGEISLLWFLVTLFWVKFIVRITSRKLEFKKSIILFLVLSMIGMYLGISEIYLPQNLDVVLVALFFFSIGLIWKKYDKIVEKHNLKILMISIILMVVCNFYGIFIEMAPRLYPCGILCFFEAIGGAVIWCNIAKLMSKIKISNSLFEYFGKGTILILCIHYIEFWHFRVGWQSLNIVTACVLKIFIIINTFLVIRCVKKLISDTLNVNGGRVCKKL